MITFSSTLTKIVSVIMVLILINVQGERRGARGTGSGRGRYVANQLVPINTNKQY